MLMLGSSSPASSSSGEFSRTRGSDVGVMEYGAERVHRLDLWTFLLDDNQIGVIGTRGVREDIISKSTLSFANQTPPLPLQFGQLSHLFSDIKKTILRV